ARGAAVDDLEQAEAGWTPVYALEPGAVLTHPSSFAPVRFALRWARDHRQSRWSLQCRTATNSAAVAQPEVDVNAGPVGRILVRGSANGGQCSRTARHCE